VTTLYICYSFSNAAICLFLLFSIILLLACFSSALETSFHWRFMLKATAVRTKEGNRDVEQVDLNGQSSSAACN
jgi:hypothetical protein